MTKRTEVVLAGLAGQGLVFAGTVLADAIGLHEGKFISQLGFYSANVRTGRSRSEVVIGDEEIDFPAATRPDIVVALTQAEAQSFASKMRPGGTLILDSDQESISPPESLLVYSAPLQAIAREKFGEEMLVNLVALGALAAICDVVALESLERTVVNQFPGSIGERNLKALKEGYSAGLLAQPVHARTGTET